MQNSTHTASNLSDSGQYFEPKNIVFNTVKSTSGWFIGGTAVAYGILKALDILGGGFLTPRSQWTTAALLGAYLGGINGHEAAKNAEIYNDKANALNKYQALPAIQSDLYATMGGLHFHYRPTKPEQFLSKAYDASWWSWLGAQMLGIAERGMSAANSNWRNVSNILLGTTILSLGAKHAAHIIGLSDARHSEQSRIGFAEKIALERAAARAGITAQAQAV